MTDEPQWYHYLGPNERAEVEQLVAEIERLRAALEAYACPGLGNCREPKLDDGSCLLAATGGRCGDEAYCALRALEPKP